MNIWDEVGFDVGRSGQRGVVAHEADHRAVGDEAPERVVVVVEIVLQRGGRRARAVGGERRAAPVELLVRRRGDDDRHAPAGQEGDRAMGRGEVVEAERLRQEVARETPRGFERGVLQLCERVEVGLADAEGGRDLLADRQALADSVVLLGLLGRLPAIDAGDHGGSDEVAFERDRGPGGHVGDGLAGHGFRLSLGIRTKRPMTSGRKHGLHCDARRRAGRGAQPGVVLHQFDGARLREFGDRSFEQAGEVLLRLRDEPVARGGREVGRGGRVQQVPRGFAARRDRQRPGSRRAPPPRPAASAPCGHGSSA